MNIAYIPEDYVSPEEEFSEIEIRMVAIVFCDILDNKSQLSIIKKLNAFEPARRVKIMGEVKNLQKYFRNLTENMSSSESDLSSVEDINAENEIYSFLKKVLIDKNSVRNEYIDSKKNLQAKPHEEPKVVVKTPKTEVKEDIELDLKQVYLEKRDAFKEYIYNKNKASTARDYMSQLDKLFSLEVKTIKDIQKIVMKAREGMNTTVPKTTNNSFRVFLSYLESFEGFDSVFIRTLQFYIKGGRVKTRKVTRVAKESDIIRSLKKINKEYTNEEQILYSALLECGCRYIELEELILNFDENKLELREGEEFSYYKMFWFRHSKNAFILFFRTKTIKKLLEIRSKVNSKLFLNRFKEKLQEDLEVESAQEVRKFVFTQMQMADVSNNNANLFQGRVSKGDIGQEHYLEIERILVKEYPKYLNYLERFEMKN